MSVTEQLAAEWQFAANAMLFAVVTGFLVFGIFACMVSDLRKAGRS